MTPGALCAVDGCKSSKRRDTHLTFFHLPVNEERRKTWAELIGRPDLARPDTKPKSHYVCCLHFEKSVIKHIPQLRPDAVPTKLLPSPPTTSSASTEPESKEISTQTKHTNINNEDSLQADDGKDIKVFCPKCNVEITHTAEGIQEDQTKIVIARVYHYFEQEYEELKKSFNGLALTPLSKFLQRTALATGVSETTVLEILQEEARRNADVREGPSQTEGPARKRPRQTDSSSEEESENNDDGDDEQSSTVHGEVLTLVIKEEPEEESLESYNEESEIYVERPKVKDEPAVSGANDALADPISIDFKTEPRTEESTSSNDTPVVQSATKSYNEAPTAASAPPAPPGRQLLLLHDDDIKMEQIESEEGFR